MDKASVIDVSAFLDAVITGSGGYLCICLGQVDGNGWHEEFFTWPTEKEKALAFVESRKDEYNVYFSSYLFSHKSTTKDCALPSRTIQADLDDADLSKMPVEPAVIVQTSPGRHQGYWILDHHVPVDIHERLSRKMTYAIEKCDRGGWSRGRKVRLPGTISHKYAAPHPIVVTKATYVEKKVKEEDGRESVVTTIAEVSPDDVELLSDGDPIEREIDEAYLTDTVNLPDIKPQALFKRIRQKLSPAVQKAYREKQTDRSIALFALYKEAFLSANLDREHVFVLARGSANNKFTDLRINGDRELWKDVLRVERHVKKLAPDIKTELFDMRRLPGPRLDKERMLAERVLTDMSQNGEFIHTKEGLVWYVLKRSGRPIYISDHSEGMFTLLHNVYGLNKTESYTDFIIATLAAHTKGLPTEATMTNLAYYSATVNTLLVHTGRQDVFRVTADSIQQVHNGFSGTLFAWDMKVDPFTPTFRSEPVDWAEELFGSAVVNVQGFTHDEAVALLKAWALFILFRHSAVAKPILALFGQMGSGKSTLFRRVYAFLYGRRKGIEALSNAESFDQAVISDPVAFFDNVDTASNWLPDRLALSSAPSELTKRALYTDFDTVHRGRQALVGVSSHDPKFGRADVVDRLLMFTFERFQHFESETEIIEHILENRDVLWGAYIKDAQAVLATDVATLPAPPQFRIEDFARIGWRCACALGFQDAFRSGIEKMRSAQKGFTLEEESLLINAIQTMLARREKKASKNGGIVPELWQSSTMLYNELEMASGDEIQFLRTYRTAQSLAKKLWNLREPLKMLFDLDQHTVEDGTVRWRIRSKGEAN